MIGTLRRLFTIHGGARLPWWAGVALVSRSRDWALILPVPLNVVVGVAWRCWLLAKVGAATRAAYAQLDWLAKLQVEREQLDRDLRWLRKRTE